MTDDRRVEDLLRRLAPQVLGALTRRYGDFDTCEDALQEALLAAATRWSVDGVPDNPAGWLYATARHRFTDQIRAEVARRRREEAVERLSAPLDGDELAETRDDTLTLLFLCCHPELGEAAQVALTLRSVAGLTTAQIAAAYLVPEPTMGQRVSRAKKRLQDVGATFSLPTPEQAHARLGAVLRVLYLIFTEGHTASSGPELISVDLTAEALRLTRELHRLMPDDGEVTGLFALMLLTDARRSTRVGADGSLIPLDQQDRARWDRSLIGEGVALITAALQAGPAGPYQLQAAIAAVHDEAASTDETDWVEILGLYALLEAALPSPVVTLNRAIALAHVRGPDAALALIDTLADDPRLARQHRLPAVRAHLLQMRGDHDGARQAYLAAARRAISGPEKRYLERRAAELNLSR